MRFSASPKGAPLYDQSKKRWLSVLMLIFSRSPGDVKFFSANPVIPRIIACALLDLYGASCRTPSSVPTGGPGDAVGVEARTHGQIVGDGPDPETPEDGRVLLDRAEVDAVLPGDGRRRDDSGLSGRRGPEHVVRSQAILHGGRGHVAAELEVGHDRVGVEDGRKDDRQGERGRRGGEDAPDLRRDPVLERRKAVALRLDRPGQQVEGDLVGKDLFG